MKAISIITEQTRYRVSEITSMIDSGKYNLNPAYHGEHEWHIITKSRLIESLLKRTEENNKMSDNNKLLPCPTCGGKAYLTYPDLTPDYSNNDAIERWNQRRQCEKCEQRAMTADEKRRRRLAMRIDTSANAYKR